MSDVNPTGIIKELTKDFDYLITDIDQPMFKTWLKTSIKANLARMNKDIPREVVDSFVDLVYLTDHV